MRMRRCQKIKAGLNERRMDFFPPFPSPLANKPRYVAAAASQDVRGPSEFLTLHVSVRDEDDGDDEEDAGEHDFAPPETDPASRRMRIRHRGFC